MLTTLPPGVPLENEVFQMLQDKDCGTIDWYYECIVNSPKKRVWKINTSPRHIDELKFPFISNQVLGEVL